MHGVGWVEFCEPHHFFAHFMVGLAALDPPYAITGPAAVGSLFAHAAPASIMVSNTERRPRCPTLPYFRHSF